MFTETAVVIYFKAVGVLPPGPKGLHGSAFFLDLPVLVVIVSVAAGFYS